MHAWPREQSSIEITAPAQGTGRARTPALRIRARDDHPRQSDGPAGWPLGIERRTGGRHAWRGSYRCLASS